jgi:phage recombination protein Bet
MQNTEITKKDPLQASLEVRGMDIRQFRVIKEILYPNVQKDETLLMAIDYCKSRNLDIMKRTIQIVPIWDSKAKCMKDTIWPSISEIRITATRTGQYAGRSEAEFGDDITETLDNVEVSYPKWCKVTVYRNVKGEKCAFTAKLFWKQEYKTAKNDTKAPNSMWAKRSYSQLEKCVEAAALRMAFPEEVGNDYIAEEAFDANEGMLNITPKSKTAQAHAIPPALEKSFNAAEIKMPIQKDDIERPMEEVFAEIEQEIIKGEVIADNSEAIEVAFKKVSEGLNSMKTEKAVNMSFDVSYKDDIEFLRAYKPDYYAELISIKSAKLEALK